MKIKKITLLLLLTAVYILGFNKKEKIYIPASLENQTSVQLTSDLQQIIDSTMGHREIKNVNFWRNFDDSEDYLYVSFENGGYAVFYKDNMEMLEYSPTRNFPGTDEKVYYCGPNSAFIKKNGGLKNIKTNEEIEIGNDALNKKANMIRSIFSNRSRKGRKINLDLSKNVPSGGSTHSFESNNLIQLNYGNRITNHVYFEISPTHGNNTGDTCAAVAAEMLLSYHNYYSDRRIIENRYLNGNTTTNKEDNPNYCTDPNRMTHETLGANGTEEVENTNPNNYFAKVISKIPKNAAYYTVSSGLKSLLKERKDSIGGDFNYEIKDNCGVWWFGFQTVDTNGIKSQIDKGNPSIVLLQKNLGAIDHYVVAYGYEKYTYPGTNDTYEGFIANFGWNHEDTNIWINSSWICAYITMEITHEHNYTSTATIPGSSRIGYKCLTCGYRTDGVIMNNSISLERHIEKYINFPLNKDLYNRFNDPNYLLKRDYYKYFFFKPTQPGNYAIQTFSNRSTNITILSSDKKTILATSSSGGYLNNAFINFFFENEIVYYVRVSLFPLKTEGDIKMAISPTESLCSNFNSIPKISCENITENLTLSRRSVSFIRFTPPTSGNYKFTTGGLSDNVMYFIDPYTGTEETLFDDDSAANRQATISKNDLCSSKEYLIIVSLYQLFTSGSSISASLAISKIT